MRKLLVLMLLVALFCPLSAQVSGYMGKRFLVELQGSTSVQNYPFAAFLRRKVSVLVSPEIHAEYAINRRNSMSLDYRYSYINYPLYVPSDSISINIDGDTSYYAHLTKTRLKQQCIGIGYRFYLTNTWGYAPFGPFFGINLRYYYNTQASKKDFPAQYIHPYIRNRTILGLEAGSRTVIKNKFTLSYSISSLVSPYGLLLGFFRERPNLRTVDSMKGISNTNFKEIRWALYKTNFFKADIGFGMLIF